MKYWMWLLTGCSSYILKDCKSKSFCWDNDFEYKQSIYNENNCWFLSVLHKILSRYELYLSLCVCFQFFSYAADVDTWMLDSLSRMLMMSSEDIGRDEAATQSMLKKLKDMKNKLQDYSSVIITLHKQAENLCELNMSPEVNARLEFIDRRYQELLELAGLREWRLLARLTFYKLGSEVGFDLGPIQPENTQKININAGIKQGYTQHTTLFVEKSQCFYQDHGHG